MCLVEFLFVKFIDYFIVIDRLSMFMSVFVCIVACIEIEFATKIEYYGHIKYIWAARLCVYTKLLLKTMSAKKKNEKK